MALGAGDQLVAGGELGELGADLGGVVAELVDGQAELEGRGVGDPQLADLAQVALGVPDAEGGEELGELSDVRELGPGVAFPVGGVDRVDVEYGSRPDQGAGGLLGADDMEGTFLGLRLLSRDLGRSSASCPTCVSSGQAWRFPSGV